MAKWVIIFYDSNGKRQQAEGVNFDTREDAMKIINGIKKTELQTRGKLSPQVKSMFALRRK